ncbi:sigma-70 family RNA polymerase sigma factor [Amycolatopsis sp. OK19-0408]|uniref:Sigma-70 family RNA polymerase sigma factor n=1 Tax=Amycolatopsis iheyensis TaxID=2945988 RepID=A0A9X2NIQ0_9PSEU|nr:sigma-70 family RNA polymerase sigma factor [Amycolatopsis iheyensis]MCR6488517.1 sigma-70 family RNA polymerase sigma factor [Amycolatopsis iheyensis]
MDELAARFEAERARLRGLAYRMLGSAAEAEDAVQEAWLRLNRAGSVDNLAAWLTTVVSRVCLDVLRTRKARREEPFEVLAEPAADADPAGEVELAESVGRALLVVLDALGPAERIAFVLHDLFAVPFDRIAPVLDRTPVAAKKLASRARQRVRGTSPLPAADLARHRRVVDAFLAAARGGDLGELLDVLAPDVVRRADAAALPVGAALEARGARAVAEETQVFGKRAHFAEAALLDGAVGVVVAPRGRLLLALAVTVEGERVAAYEVIADPARLAALHVTLLA